MYKLSCVFLLLFFIFSINKGFGQISEGGKPFSFTNKAALKATIPFIRMSNFDVEKVKAEAKKKSNGKYFEFGHSLDLEKGINDTGEWTELKNGDRIWRLGIKSEGAYAINLVFSKYKLPAGANLFIYNSDRTMVLGAFTNRINQADKQLGVMPVSGDEIILEYYEPAQVKGKGELVVGKVVHAFEDIFPIMKAYGFGRADECNMNINCPDGAEWEQQKRSVTLILAGNGLCSGALINNTANDEKPYILTANHCLPSGNDVSTWVFAFNFESPDCADIEGPSNQTVSGATLTAKYAPSDFLLVEMNSKAPESYNVFYSGWSREITDASRTVSIHHPSGDIKKISFDDNATQFDPALPNMWKVQWDRNTTTEPGSSGAPIFDQNKRIIGQLYGGDASCDNPNGPDFFGKLDISWSGGGRPSSRLMDWLDPIGSAATFIDGREAGEVKQICASEALNPQNTRVNRVVYGDTDVLLEGECRTYSDLTNFVADVQIGDELNIDVYLGTCGAENDKRIRIYIDWNADSDFDDEGELVKTSEVINSSSELFSTSIAVPAHAVPGTSMPMRIIVWESAFDEPVGACGHYGYGETVDFTLNVEPYTGLPPEVTSLSPSIGTAGSIVTLEGYFAGVTSVTFNDIEAHYTIISENVLQVTVPYRNATGIIAVSNASGTAESQELFHAIPIYCNSRAASAEDAIISYVGIGSINNTSPQNCRTYTDYTNLSTEITEGQVLPLVVRAGTCNGRYDKRVKIFMDWNGNGTFTDAGELVGTSRILTGTDVTFSTNVNVPAQTAGVVGMRVICWETNSNSDVSSCGFYDYGETQDYILINKSPSITSNKPPVLAEQKVSIFNYPNPFSGSTAFQISSDKNRKLKLEIYNIYGQLVKVIAEQYFSAGVHEVQFYDPKLASGTYIYKLSGEGVNISKKIINY